MSSQQHVTFPHLSVYAVTGGFPNIHQDVPPSAVFLFLFLLAAVFHMTTLQLNMRKGHKFVISGAVFGFSMSRIVTCSLRIAWACHPTSVSLAIASQIFNSAGVVVLFVITVIFSQRILRSVHPRFQWHKTVSIAFKAWTGMIIAVLVIIIITTVLSFYTINPHKQSQYGAARKFGVIFFAVYAFSPIIVVATALLLPKRDTVAPFGKRGNLKEQMMIVVFAAFWLSFGAAIRAGTIFYPRLIANPAWYQSRAFFYLAYFTIEILVVYTFAIVRIDQRFYIPDKAERIAIRDGQTGSTSDVEKGDSEAEKQNRLDAENFD